MEFSLVQTRLSCYALIFLIESHLEYVTNWLQLSKQVFHLDNHKWEELEREYLVGSKGFFATTGLVS